MWQSVVARRWLILTFIAGSLLSVLTTYWIGRYNQRVGQEQFGQLIEVAVRRVTSTMTRYEYGLRGARGAVVAAGLETLNRETFRRYADTRDLPREFPGARGFGVIRRVSPAAGGDFVEAAVRNGHADFRVHQLAPWLGEHYVIQYIEPYAPNTLAIGLDIASEPRRRVAAQAAVRTGLATLTAPIRLVQAPTAKSGSFLILLPIYRPDMPLSTETERQTAAFGWTYAILNMAEILDAAQLQQDDFDLVMRDAEYTGPEGQFYSSRAALAPSLLAKTVEIPMFGRRWLAEVHARPSFFAQLHLLNTYYVLFGGFLLSILSTLLVGLYLQASRRARQLQQEESHRAAIVAASTDAIVGVDLAGRIQSWNRGAEQIFGYTSQEAIGQPLAKLWMDSEPAGEESVVERCARGQIVPTFEALRRRSDGTEVEVAICASPLRDSDGRVVGAATTFRDISQQRAAEAGLVKLSQELERQVRERTANLEAARRDLRNIMDALPSLIGYWDANLINRFANRAYQASIGTEVELLGRSMRELVGDAVFEELLPRAEAALRGEPQTFQRLLPWPGVKGKREVLVNYVPDLVNGVAQGFYVVIHDITELVQTQRRADAAVRENQLLLQTIRDHAIVSMSDSSDRIIEVNDAFCAISGYARDELLGQRHKKINSGLHDGAFWNALWTAITQGRSWRGEICNRAKDGSLYWVDSIITPFFGEDGQLDRFISIRFDITQRKQVEAALREGTERFTFAAGAAGIGVWEFDPNANTLRWDDQMYCLYGREHGTRIEPYTLWSQSLHPEDIERCERELGDCLTGVAPFDTEFRVVWPNGEIRHLKATGQVQMDAAGIPLKMIGVNIDITARKRAELEFQATSSLLRTVLSSATSISVIAATPDLTIKVFNDGAERLLGYKKEEVVNRATPILIHDEKEVEDRSRELSARLGKPIVGGEVFIEPSTMGKPSEWTYVRKDGSRVPVSLVVTDMRDEAGQLVGYVGVAQDTTQQKQVERALKDAKERAEQTSLAKSQFLANMSHEIRTPMNAVIGLSYLLGQTRLNADQSDLLSKIKVASGTLLGLINDILDVSKIEAGELSIENVGFNLVHVIRDLSSTIQVQAEAKQIGFELDIAESLPRAVLGDPLRVAQIITNLLTNAIKFTSHGKVSLIARVLTETPERYSLRFEVHDTGIGVSPDVAARLFQPFAQADASTTRQFGGTGLGLSIVRQLTELMGGRVGLESTLGKGTQFWVELTLDRCEPSAVMTRANSASEQPGGRLAGVRVLVVDDSDVNQEVARRILELEGAEVSLAGDGVEAVEAVRSRPDYFDVILMDVQMPRMHGLEATRIIRGQLRMRTLPVVALTAGAMMSQRQEAKAAGMDAFLGKPFSPAGMIKTIVGLVPQPKDRAVSPTRPTMSTSTIDEAWPAVDGINTDEAFDRMGGDWELFVSLLGRMLNEFADLADRGTVEHGTSLTDLAALFHKLRGSSGNVSAHRIHALAAQAETAARAGDVAMTTQLLGDLGAALKTLRAHAQPALASVATVAPEFAVESAALDPGQVDGLLMALQHQSLDAFDQLEAIAGGLRNVLGDERFARLRMQVDNLQFADAAALVRSGLG